MREMQPRRIVQKIVSGGQTGADRAALDAAISLDIPHGGWVPRGRLTELGPLSEEYCMTEADSAWPAVRTELNVRDSDATLIVSHGNLTGGSALTRRLARRHAKPWLHVDLFRLNGTEATEAIRDWLREVRPQVLNVAGPRASTDGKIYRKVFDLLRAVFTSSRRHKTSASRRG
jgi:hypothetical protein